jgi:hypothetical protein
MPDRSHHYQRVFAKRGLLDVEFLKTGCQQEQELRR